MLLPAALGDAVVQALGVGDEQIVADQLHFAAELARQLLPALPVVFGQAVLDRADRPALAQFLPQVDHLVRSGDAVGLALEEAVAGLALFLGLVEQFRCGGIERENDVLAELVAGLLDGLGQHFQSFIAAFDVGSKAAFVADGGAEMAIVQHVLEMVKHLGPHAQSVAEVGAPSGIIMNSWKSTLLSACLPPLRTFIIGTGR